MQKYKDEVFKQNASKDNHIFINEKLNRALKKQMDKPKKDKKKSKKEEQTEEGTGGSNFEGVEKTEVEKTDAQESFGGDLSSICIGPMEQIADADFMDDSV